MTLLDMAPGAAPARIRPTASSSGKRSNRATANALNGMMVNWATEPIRTRAGLLRIRRKSSIRSTAPMPNIVRAKNHLFQGAKALNGSGQAYAAKPPRTTQIAKYRV